MIFIYNMKLIRRGIYMVDYKSGKTRYTPDNLGSLYLDESKLSDNERPVIYIGGQMEHRIHRL